MQKDTDLLIQIGATVKRLRSELGLSQERLSELSSVDRTFISSIEHGERNVSVMTLCQIAHALERDFVSFIEETRKTAR